MNRKLQRGGGATLFVKNTLSARLVESISICCNNLFESVTVEIELKQKKHILVSCMYRKPGSNLEELNEQVEKMLRLHRNKNLYVCGDFNVNLLKYNSHQQTRHFMDMFFSLWLLPLITKPTRLNSTTESLIDNIFTNVLETEHHSGASSLITCQCSQFAENNL